MSKTLEVVNFSLDIGEKTAQCMQQARLNRGGFCSISCSFSNRILSCLKDLWQFYLNLTEANREEKPNWRLEYMMTKAFGIKDIQPGSLHELALKFEAPESKDFQQYYTYFMVSYNDTVICTGECKTVQVCSVQFLDQESYSECVQKIKGENF